MPSSRATIAAGTRPPRVMQTIASKGPAPLSRHANARESRWNWSHETGKIFAGSTGRSGGFIADRLVAPSGPSLQGIDPIDHVTARHQRGREVPGNDLDILALRILGERIEGIFRAAAVDRIELADDPKQWHRRRRRAYQRSILGHDRRSLRIEPAQIDGRRCSCRQRDALRHVGEALPHIALAFGDQDLGARYRIADETAHIS